jgi:cation transport regulator
MRYETRGDLPERLTSVLPEEAQQLYLERYQEAWDTYNPRVAGGLSRQALAHREGWAAVGREYEQHEGTGKWYRRQEGPPDDEGRPTVIDVIRDRLRI